MCTKDNYNNVMSDIAKYRTMKKEIESELAALEEELKTYMTDNELENEKKMLAKTLSSVATAMLTSAANSRCVFVYHQPKQPTELKKFRKF